MNQFESSTSSRYGSHARTGSSSAGRMEEVKSYLGQGFQNVEGMVAKHPASSAFVVFGVGLGLGFILGNAIGTATHASRSRLIDSRRAEKFGRQILDTIAEYLPEPVASHIR